MPPALTADAFAKLLDRLDADRERAGEQYEALRRRLTRFFEWRGAPFPDEHADETFNRVARKLDEGVTIANIGGYCHEVARLVCLEAFKGRDSKRSSLDTSHAATFAADTTEEAAQQELRMACLEDCLRALSRENRDLVIEYYQDERRARIERRKALAERLGVRRDALANRAQRLRDNLERCVSAGLSRKSAI
jgi:DNA-directed RNA polymerase specialized sigma24 family protein